MNLDALPLIKHHCGNVMICMFTKIFSSLNNLNLIILACKLLTHSLNHMFVDVDMHDLRLCLTLMVKRIIKSIFQLSLFC